MGIILEGIGFSLTKEPLISGKMFKKGTILVLPKIILADEVLQKCEI
jgi:hypothetical protein